MKSVGGSWASYLLAGVSAAGDDGDSADLEELHLDGVGWRVSDGVMKCFAT